jgi:hypothetical protein
MTAIVVFLASLTVFQSMFIVYIVSSSRKLRDDLRRTLQREHDGLTAIGVAVRKPGNTRINVCEALMATRTQAMEHMESMLQELEKQV